MLSIVSGANQCSPLLQPPDVPARRAWLQPGHCRLPGSLPLHPHGRGGPGRYISTVFLVHLIANFLCLDLLQNLPLFTLFGKCLEKCLEKISENKSLPLDNSNCQHLSRKHSFLVEDLGCEIRGILVKTIIISENH